MNNGIRTTIFPINIHPRHTFISGGNYQQFNKREMIKILYKAHVQYQGEGADFEVLYNEFAVIRETPCYWYVQDNDYVNGKAVDKTAKNAYAFDTKEKALFNLLKRRERFNRILCHKISQNEYVIDELRKQIDNGKTNTIR